MRNVNRKSIVAAAMATIGLMGTASMSRAATLSNSLYAVYGGGLNDYAKGSAFNTGGNGSTVVSSGSGVTDVAFDSSGNVYYSATGGLIDEVGQGTPFATGVTGAAQMAFNPVNGDLYVAGGSTGNVYQVTSGGVVSTYATITGGTLNITGLAIDSTGDVFVSNKAATTAGNEIYEITGGVATPFAVTTTFANPGYLAINSSTNNNLYVANTNAAGSFQGTINEITPAGVKLDPWSNGGNVVSTGTMQFIDGIAFDGQGNLYVAFLPGGSSTTGIQEVVSFGALTSVETDTGTSEGEFAFNTAATPEPASIAFLGLAATGLLMRRRRKC